MPIFLFVEKDLRKDENMTSALRCSLDSPKFKQMLTKELEESLSYAVDEAVKYQA
jgi:hypothetical protein